MAKFIPADASQPEREVQPKNGKKFTLQEWQSYVGGYVQVVQTNDGSAVLMDEDGKLKDRPVNLRATALLFGIIALADQVVGDVLVLTAEEFADDE